MTTLRETTTDARPETEAEAALDAGSDGLIAEPSGEGTLVRMWGSVDESLRTQASAVMAHALARPGPVEIDAARLDFLDSSGLAFLLQLVRAAREDGRAVVLRDPPDLVVEMLQVLGLGGEVPLEFSSR